MPFAFTCDCMGDHPSCLEARNDQATRIQFDTVLRICNWIDKQETNHLCTGSTIGKCGEFLNITHRCVLPEIEENYGPDTIWRCECGNLYRTFWNGDFEWRQLPKYLWDEEKQAIKTVHLATNIQETPQKKRRFMGWR